MSRVGKTSGPLTIWVAQGNWVDPRSLKDFSSIIYSPVGPGEVKIGFLCEALTILELTL